MTKITRRTFVKRSGVATLGGALGLGLLPSLTRKLHAEDTSVQSGQGVEILHATTTDVSTWKVNGGLLSISQTLVSTAALGVCVPSLKVTRTYVFNYTKVTLTGVYSAVSNLVIHRYYKCVDGVPTMTYAYGNNIGPIGITNGSEAIGTMQPGFNDADGGQTSSGKARLIFPDGVWTDWYEGANLPYQVICCNLLI